MKERLIQILELEQLSPSKFADIIGVQRSSISHVLSGRNKPSFDFLQRTLKAFPMLNADWLILGKGTMYEQMGRGVSEKLFDAPQGLAEAPSGDDITEDIESIDETQPPEEDIIGSQPVGEGGVPLEKDQVKRIVQVMVFYDDDTFRSYEPSQ